MRPFVLLTFAVGLCSCGSAPIATPTDHQIIPGLRIGSAALGMSRDEVREVLGVPTQLVDPKGGGPTCTLSGDTEDWHYDAPPPAPAGDWLTVSFPVGKCDAADDGVIAVAVFTDNYYLANGIGAGASDDDVAGYFGPPDCVYKDGSESDLIYREGLMYRHDKQHPKGFFLVFDARQWNAVVKRLECTPPPQTDR